MWQFLRNVLKGDKTEITVVLLDEKDPSLSGSLKINNRFFVLLVAIILFVSSAIAFLALFLTPLGNIFSDRQSESIRSELLAITDRIDQLQDSLETRDLQLEDMKRVIRLNIDTLYMAGPNASIGPDEATAGYASLPMVDFDLLKPRDILSGLGTGEPLLISGSPTGSENPELLMWPADGTLTQDFLPDEGHFGIDIALAEGAPFMSVETGRVIHSAWTVEYGYVLMVQHRNAMVTVYKHAASLAVASGDLVLRGQVVGTVGNRGVLSSGSHLHLEVWKSARAINPLTLLVP